MCECVRACGTLGPFLPTGDEKVTARLCVCIIHVLAHYQHPSAQGMVMDNLYMYFMYQP